MIATLFHSVCRSLASISNINRYLRFSSRKDTGRSDQVFKENNFFVYRLPESLGLGLSIFSIPNLSVLLIFGLGGSSDEERGHV